VHGFIADDRIVRLLDALKLYDKLQDPETGLYREGPAYLYDMLVEERGAA